MYTDSFYSPFGDFFGPRYTQRQAPPRRYHNNYDPFFPFDEPRPIPQRKYRQPQRCERTNNPRTSPPQKVSELSPPKTSRLSPRALQLLNEKVTLIQSAFRRHLVQKKNILPNLRRLKEVKEKVNRAHEKFSNIISTNPELAGEKLRMTYAEYEENLTKALLELDSVITRGVDIVRDSRKTLVKKINSELAKVDAKKPEIRESVRREQEALEQLRLQKEAEEAERIRLEEEEQAKLEAEQALVESESSSEDEFESEQDLGSEWELVQHSEDSNEHEDIPMSDSESMSVVEDSEAEERLQHRLELIRQEEERLAKEKEEIDRLLAQWNNKKAKLEEMKSSLLSSDSMQL